MKYQNIREEELKNRVGQDYFPNYDYNKIIGNLDFCVGKQQNQKELFEETFLLWAEAKQGSSDVYKSIVQLILTIGKARIFDKFLPPALLGAFDGEKIAFLPYSEIQEIFYLNDFNWNVTPSNHDSKEFKLIYDKAKQTIDEKALRFDFLKDDLELKSFIKDNFVDGKFDLNKIKIDKNNFIAIYNKWLLKVKPSIIMNWENAKKKSIIEADFYLADLISEENVTLKEKLFVRLKKNIYELDRRLNDMGMFDLISTQFNDGQVAHTQFWNKYERPPKEEYWDYIVERRDLLVPQDVRERKGSFFTPQIWVELSQQYLGDVLGEHWQDEYYIWDCAAGTGNLLTGLSNKYHIYASTLDKQDVEVMQDRIQNGANLLSDHVFQFDFLNDDFIPKSKGGKLPDGLYNILSDPKERKKLVIYINPPYAEHLDKKNTLGKEQSKNKSGLKFTKIDSLYSSKYGNKASRELFVQFFIRIHEEISGSIIGAFSKLKYLNSSNFVEFRNSFRGKYEKGFMCSASTFDNVKGKFPIGFLIWNTNSEDEIKSLSLDIINNDGSYRSKKQVYVSKEPKGKSSMNDWIKKFDFPNNQYFLGHLNCSSQDFLHQNYTGITVQKQNSAYKQLIISEQNLIQVAIYFAVSFCIEATWINDRDQFLYPNDEWEKDTEFQNDCLTFTLFHGQNRISESVGRNHWIPFKEQEVEPKERFESNFMTKYIQGKLKSNGNGTLLEPEKIRTTPLNFSPQAKAVFDAGRELWKYYHQQKDSLANAALYDIRAHFQGRNEKGKMNNKSSDKTYNNLINILRQQLNELSDKIKIKVYAYGFLK